MENYKYGTEIKKVRKSHKLSQMDLADNICSQAMLSRIENNEVIPNVLLMVKLCDKLEISVYDIFER